MGTASADWAIILQSTRMCAYAEEGLSPHDPAKRGRGVKIELVTYSNGELAESDFEAFAKQCGKFTMTICGVCHDRFIVVDGKEVFWTGASLKDAGRLTFAAAKMGTEIIPGLLASIRKATSERPARRAGLMRIISCGAGRRVGGRPGDVMSDLGASRPVSRIPSVESANRGVDAFDGTTSSPQPDFAKVNARPFPGRVGGRGIRYPLQ